MSRRSIGTGKSAAKSKAVPRPHSRTNPAFRKTPIIDTGPAFSKTPTIDDTGPAFRETPTV